MVQTDLCDLGSMITFESGGESLDLSEEECPEKELGLIFVKILERSGNFLRKFLTKFSS